MTAEISRRGFPNPKRTYSAIFHNTCLFFNNSLLFLANSAITTDTQESKTDDFLDCSDNLRCFPEIVDPVRKSPAISI